MRRKDQTDLFRDKYPDKAVFMTLVLYLVVFSTIILRLSLIRAFNFDEFQVLYTSASLIRGKALYADHMGIHFPFVNILLSLFIKVLGFHTSTILAARLFTSLFFYLTLFFTFKITELLWDKVHGVLAVALVMSTIVFVNKGIEIRHDVFNMAFNTVGVYWGLKYLKENSRHFAWLSGLFLGLALASTQKAIVWNIGISFGLFLSLIRLKGSDKLPEAIALFGGGFVIPLVFSVGYLILFCGENPTAFFENTVINVLSYFSPQKASAFYSFPYTKASFLKALFYENGFFYVLSLIGLFTSLVAWVRRGVKEGVIGFWALIGVLFYLYTSRPFLQSLLPTMPALGILAVGLIMKFRVRLQQDSMKKNVLVSLMVLVLMLGWPSYIIAFKLQQNRTMTEQIENISFCLANLKPDDKVLCFSQQQIYFDPAFRFYGDECGRSIHELDPECFEQKMIRHKCKVIINDRRTQNLSRTIQEKLKNHFLLANVGTILIPGFLVAPKSIVEKEIWVPGCYHSSTREVTIDGKSIEDNVIDLEQKTYTFENPTFNTVAILYVFDRERFIVKLEKNGIH